ncbi:MAG: C1 family peptidase [Chthoniobacter sp.]|uniref:C1 family peptidase n=1 Tax=Chthoniobacter sp. TaxID=2510640 RepID=UPI0032A99BAA
MKQLLGEIYELLQESEAAEENNVRPARSPNVPWADETESANAGTSGRMGQGGGFLRQGGGFLRQGGGFLREGGGFLRQGGGFLREGGGFLRDGGGFLRVRNGAAPEVAYVPPAFFSNTRWANRGLGYLPDQTDCHDHLLFDSDEEKKLEAFYSALVKVVEDRQSEPPERQSPFQPEYLKRARDLCRDLVDGKLSDDALRKQREAFDLPARNLGDTGYLTAVEDQGEISSCTAHAVVGMAEYLIKAATYETQDLSRLYLYKATRDLMGVSGDTGAYIRSTIKAMATLGIPAERWWAYNPEFLDCTPPPLTYAIAANFKALTYKRIDGNGFSTEMTLLLLLHVLAAGFPVAFGFPLYRSIVAAQAGSAIIPAPGVLSGDRQIGGHAVLAVGYDTSIEYQGLDAQQNIIPKKGALIIKNSWGEDWGDGGFAYLPFDYVLKGLALDFWTIFNSAWISEKRFIDPDDGQ